MFLTSEKMTDLLTDNSDVVQLAIFGHTHMDEIKILKAEMPGHYPVRPTNITVDAKGVTAEPKAVAMKVVSSISPINGTKPSFTIAQIDPSTAVLKDYKVFVASNLTGNDAVWKEEYDFARSYHEAEFTSTSVSQLITGFVADPGAKSQASKNYIQDFSVGYLSPVLTMFWPEYVCTLSNHTQKAFKECVCPAAQ